MNRPTWLQHRIRPRVAALIIGAWILLPSAWLWFSVSQPFVAAHPATKPSVRADPGRLQADVQVDLGPILKMLVADMTRDNGGRIDLTLPGAGVPLPYVSYGGTAMITLGFALGILQAISKAKKIIQS